MFEQVFVDSIKIMLLTNLQYSYVGMNIRSMVRVGICHVWQWGGGGGGLLRFSTLGSFITAGRLHPLEGLDPQYGH